MSSRLKPLPTLRLTRAPESRWPRIKNKPLSVWLSRVYQVCLWLQPDGQLVLSVTRRNRAAGIPWDDLQAIKTATGFGTWQAVEIYPPDSQLVYKANARHLWLSHEAKAIGWAS